MPGVDYSRFAEMEVSDEDAEDDLLLARQLEKDFAYNERTRSLQKEKEKAAVPARLGTVSFSPSPKDTRKGTISELFAEMGHLDRQTLTAAERGAKQMDTKKTLNTKLSGK